MLNYDASIGRAELIATAAWMSTGMNYDYLNPFFTINSRNRVNTLVVKGGITLPAGKFTKIKMVLSDENSTVKTNNYADTINHNTASLTISAERKMWKRLGMVILFRETIDDSRFLVPDFSAGAEFRLFSNEDHFLKLNFSRNTRIATLNDRYYNPGGNPDLKNEFAYSFESGYKMTQELSPLLQFSSEICYHNNLIRDMILWHETDPFVWVADNIGKVNSSGIEASASVKYSGTRMGFNIDGAYSYTRAKDAGTTDESVKDKQLMYIPENQVKGTTGIYFGNLFGRWETSYMGKIFTSADNSVSLKSYMLNNLTAGFKWKRGLFSGSIRVRIDNILNISYETIAGYPQPGRSFHTILSLSVR
jgi:iron complex outermembrane receptor protein